MVSSVAKLCLPLNDTPKYELVLNCLSIANFGNDLFIFAFGQCCAVSNLPYGLTGQSLNPIKINTTIYHSINTNYDYPQKREESKKPQAERWWFSRSLNRSNTSTRVFCGNPKKAYSDPFCKCLHLLSPSPRLKLCQKMFYIFRLLLHF